VYFRPRANLAVRDVGGEIVVFDRAGGRVHTLNPTAAFVWATLDGQTDSDAIAARVAERFAVESAVAVRDVQALLEQLTALNLLERSSEGEEHGDE
jgi:PqqD family protein of HPr-rel-A system